MTLTLSKESVLYKSGDDQKNLLELKLPLPDVDNNAYNLHDIQKDNDHLPDHKSDLESNYYQNQVASSGSIFIRKHVGLPANTRQFPKSILWRVLRKSTVIELTVVDIETNNQPTPIFRTIRIFTPLPVFERCIVFSEEKDHLIIDILAKPGFLYTLQIEFAQFIVSGNNHIGLADENAHQWRSIKFPYGFDIRKPYLLHAMSSKVLLASTVDGSLIKFLRESPLGDISWYPFQDSGKGLSLSSLLPWGHSHSVPGKPDLSAKTVISIDSLPVKSNHTTSNFVVTVSINRAMKVWSLESMSVAIEKILDSSPSPATTAFLDSSANPRHVSLAHHFNDSSHGLHHGLLVTYVPFEEGLFKIWQLNYESGESPTLIDLGEDFEIVPVSPGDKTSIWFVADFNLVSYSDRLMLAVSWKSDISTITRSCIIPKNGRGGVKSPYWTVVKSESFDKDDLSIISSTTSISETHTEGFIHKLFGPTGYSAETIRTALPVYANHYGPIGNDDINDTRLSLKDQVSRIVGAAVSVVNSSQSLPSNFKAYKRDLHLQWIRFDRLCKELERQGHEFLSLVYDDHNDRFSVIKSSFVYLLRPLSNLEILYFNRCAAPIKHEVEIIAEVLGTIDYPLIESILRTLDSMVIFRRFLSQDVRSDLLVILKEQFNGRERYITADRVAYMYETILDGKVSESSLGTLVTALYDIPDLDNVIQSILDICRSNGKKPDEVLPLTYLGAHSYNSMLHNFFGTGRIIIFDIIILLLLSSSHPDLVGEYLTDYPSSFALFKSFTAVTDLQLTDASSSYNNDVSSDPFVSAVQRLSVTDDSAQVNDNLSFLESFLIRRKLAGSTINLEFIWDHINISEPIKAANLAVDMFLQVKNATNGTGNSTDLIEYINTYLPSDNFSTFIKGNILLSSGEQSKGALLLRSSSIALSSKTLKLSLLQLETVKKLHEIYWLPGNLGNGLAHYNNAVSQMAVSIGAPTQALEFSQLAADNLDSSDDKLELQIYSTLLNSALDLREYDEAYNALVELGLCECPEIQLKTAVEHLVISMASNGEGLKLCRLPFIGMTHIVSNLLESKVEDTKGTYDHLLIPFYKLLYAWKMERGDYQGGK